MEEELLLQIKAFIDKENKSKLKSILGDLYPADIAELISDLSAQDIEVLVSVISAEKIAFSLSELDYDSRHILLNLLKPDKLKDILSKMYADDIADLLGTLSIGKGKELLTLMKKEDAKKIQNLLGYDEESAGGIMTTEYIAIKEGKTAQQALEKIREIATKTEMIYYIYIVNQRQRLVGVISMRELITAPPDKDLKYLMHTKAINVRVDLDREEVAAIISKYDLLAIPVINRKGQLLGIITVDDILDVIEEEATEDIHKMAGNVEFRSDNRGDIINGVLKRLPWLIILLFASLLSGTVLQFFEDTLDTVVALAFFMPTLAGTGGNAATQSLAVVVRGLAIGEIKVKEILGYLWDEIKVGGLIALACALIIGIIAFFWQGNFMLGVVVGLAMFCNIVTATILGTTIPFIIDYLGADPAVAAGPFITTLIDVSGYFIYFGLAKLFIEHLV